MRRRIVLAGYAALVSALVLLVAACGGSTPSDTTSPPPPPVVTVATVSIAPASVVLATSQTSAMIATVRDASGNALSGRAVSWSTSATTVASVSTDGLVTAVGAGTASITATSDGKSGSATVTVTAPATTTVQTTGGTAQSADSRVSLTFPAGAVNTAMPVAITPVASGSLTTTQAAPNSLGNTLFEFGPSGTQFNKPVLATFSYDASALPAGADLRLLAINTFVGNAWTPVQPTIVDTVAHTVSALITHFSLYTACLSFCNPAQPQAPPDLSVGVNTGGLRLLQGATSPVITGSVWYAGNVPIAPTYTLTQPCAYIGCTPLPAGMITGAFTDLGETNPGSCVTLNPACGRAFSFAISVSPSTPPGSYPVAVDVSASVGGVVRHGQSWAINIDVPGPGYSVSLSPASVSLAQGTSTTSTVTVTRANGFALPVTLTAETLESGVSVSFSPSVVSGTSSVMTVTASSSARAGEHAPTLRASAPGLASLSVPFGLTVTNAVVSGFTLSGAPSAITLNAGASGSTAVLATRTGGFAGTISYAVSGMPSGMTASIAATAKPDSLTLSASAGVSMPAGSYPLTVTGTSGSQVRTAVVTVSVSTSGTQAVHLDFGPCPASVKPLWMAFQDGSGAFVRVVPTGDVYDFTMTSARGTIAKVVLNGSTYTTNINYWSRGELAQMSSRPVCGTTTAPTTKTVNASATNILSTNVSVSIGSSFSSPDNAGAGIQNVLTNVPSGPQTAIAFNYGTLRQGIIRRGVDIPNGGTLPPFDFASSEVFTQASAGLTLPGATSVGMSYLTSTSSGCSTNRLYSPTPASVNTIFGIPASQQEAGDLHALYATSASGQTISAWFHSMTAQSLSFGASLSAGALTNANNSSFKQIHAATTLSSDYETLSLLYGDTNHGIAVASSIRYAGGPNVTLTTPNLLGVAGYQATWAPAASSTVNYFLIAESGGASCVDGAVRRQAQLSGTM